MVVLRRGRPVSLAGCGWLERAERPAWRAQAENACLARGLVKPSRLYRAAAGIDGPGICGLTHPFKVSALDDGAVALDKTVTIDCPMVAGARGLARRGRAAGRRGAIRRSGRRARGVRRLFLPLRRQHAGRAAVRARLRQRGRRLRLRPRRRARDRHRARLEAAPARRNRRSCTRPTRAPASISPPCSGRAPTSSTTTISISIWRCTARPTPARAAIAGRRPRPNLLPPPARPDGLPPAPEIDEPMDVARACRCGRTPARSTCTDPRRRSRRRSPSRSSPRRRRCCRPTTSTARRPRRSRCRKTGLSLRR